MYRCFINQYKSIWWNIYWWHCISKIIMCLQRPFPNWKGAISRKPSAEMILSTLFIVFRQISTLFIVFRQKVWPSLWSCSLERLIIRLIRNVNCEFDFFKANIILVWKYPIIRINTNKISQALGPSFSRSNSY